MKPLWTRDFSLAFAANFLMAFAFYLLMPTLPLYLTGQLHISKAMVGTIMASYVVAALAMRPFSGFLIDHFPRKMLYVISFAFFALLSFTYLSASSESTILAIRIVHGLIWGVITTAGNTLALDIIPSERRGEGIGFYGMSMNIAMALGPMTGILLSESRPFSQVFTVAVVSSVLGLILALCIRAPIHAPQPHRVLSLDRFLLIRGIPTGIGLLFVTISYGLILAFAAMYGKDHHIQNTGLFFVVMALGIIVARLLTGKLLDRNLCKHVGIAGGILAAFSLLLLGIYPVAACYFAVAFSLGLGYGMNFPAVQTIIINHGDHHQRGTANSTFFTAFDIGVGIGIVLGGQIAQYSDLSMAFLVVAAMALLGTGILGLTQGKG